MSVEFMHLQRDAAQPLSVSGGILRARKERKEEAQGKRRNGGILGGARASILCLVGTCNETFVASLRSAAADAKQPSIDYETVWLCERLGNSHGREKPYYGVSKQEVQLLWPVPWWL